MIRFKAVQTIERPADDVWALAADAVRHPEWMNVSDARVLSGIPTQVGARVQEGVRLGPRRLEVEMEVSAADPGLRIAWRVLRGPIQGEVELNLEPLEMGRTRATYAGTLKLSGLWRLLQPVMAGEIRTGEAAELARLKALLESTPVSAMASV